MLRHRQALAERAVAAVLAKLRRDGIVDDAEIEGVARDADAIMGERIGDQPAPFVLKAHD